MSILAVCSHFFSNLSVCSRSRGQKAPTLLVGLSCVFNHLLMPFFCLFVFIKIIDGVACLNLTAD